jgi:hypothetical protein
MSDEPDRQDLEDRVDQLEQTISKMLPSRRDALKLGGAALVGGAAMSGSASAGTQQAGTIGTATNPVDLESEDINNADTVTTQELDATNLNSDTLSVETTTNTIQPTVGGIRQIYNQFPNLNNASDHVQVTNVGTSNTDITERVAATGRGGSLVSVVGQGPSGEGFASLIHYTQRGSDVTVLSDIETNGGPSGRTYTTGSFAPLQLRMSSDTYTVVARTFEVAVP